MKSDYGRTFRKQLGHFPVWDVGTPVAVGDYGEVHDGCFHKLGNVQQEFQTRTEVAQSEPAFWEFASEGVARSDGELSASVAAIQAQASMKVHFSEAYSLFVMAPRSVVASLANISAVARALKYHPLRFPREYVIVTSLRSTPWLLLMMNTNARATISVSGDPGLLSDLKNGRIDGAAGLEVGGDAGLRSLGLNGAVYVDLIKLRWLDGKPKPAAEIVRSEREDEHWESLDAGTFA